MLIARNVDRKKKLRGRVVQTSISGAPSRISYAGPAVQTVNH